MVMLLYMHVPYIQQKDIGDQHNSKANQICSLPLLCYISFLRLSWLVPRGLCDFENGWHGRHAWEKECRTTGDAESDQHFPRGRWG